MRIETDSIISFIKNKIYENQKILNDKKIILADDLRKEKEFENKIYDELINDILKCYDLYIPNILFDILTRNFNKHHTKIIFWDNSELIIEKDMITGVSGEFVLLYPLRNSEYNYKISDLCEKAINITEIKEIQTLDDNYCAKQ